MFVQSHVSTDRGHKHSNGCSEVAIWISQLPPPPAPPPLGMRGAANAVVEGGGLEVNQVDPPPTLPLPSLGADANIQSAEDTADAEVLLDAVGHAGPTASSSEVMAILREQRRASIQRSITSLDESIRLLTTTLVDVR